MVPGAEGFFHETRAAFAGAARRLALEGPVDETADRHLAVVTYTGADVRYKAVLGLWAGDVEIHVCRDAGATECKVGVEKLARAAGIAGSRREASFGARSLRQLRKSLTSQVRYVELVHPLVTVELMRAAGAREWSRPLVR
ncbi:hypothetical protein DI272_28195 [Streptomyces sp. Act143]|uniref:hypothetical protein n=1 Tax=Streptomyces sp. Act143 TaxID=2200760 RepID=UPI000D6816E5|nr:hypothetical protein [Streptomyces sp. Act143]PWI17613.1 hypothetical protein DI272_28195 [Streptomyces sp. Act143]